MRPPSRALRLVPVVGLLFVAGLARADDPGDPQEGLIRRAREAYAAKDEGALRGVVSADDPWKVVSALCALGDLDVAAALAVLQKGPHVERLPAHVEAWRAWKGDRALAAKLYRDLRAGERTFVAGKHEEAFALLSRVKPPEDMPATMSQRLHFVLSVVQERLGNNDGKLTESLAAARLARDLGWWGRAWTGANAAYDAAITDGRGAEAVEAGDIALRTAQAYGNEEWISGSRGRRGAAVFAAGRVDEGLAEMQASLAWRDAHPEAPRDPALATALGLAFAATGRAPEAITLLERVLAAPGDLGAEGLLQAALSLSDAYQAEGRFADASARLHDALARADESTPPRNRAEILVRVGFLERVLGRFAQSLAAFQEAVEFAAQSGDGKVIAVANAGLANQLQSVGDFAGARTALKTAIERAESGGATHSVPTLRAMLGAVEREDGDPAAAREQLLEARRGAESSNDRAARVAALVQFSLLESAEGHADPAISMLTDAVSLCRAFGDGRGEANALAYLAEALVRAGRSPEALARAAEAERRGGEIGSAEAVVYARMVRAQASFGAGDAAGAVAAARDGVTELRRLARRHPDERAAGARESWDGLFSAGLRAARSRDDTAAFAEFLESGRAQSLREVLGGNDALRATEVPPELARELAQATTALRVARDQVGHFAAGTDMGAAQARLAAAQATLQRVEERIEARQLAAASLAIPATASLAEIRGAIPKGTALVEHAIVGDDVLALVVTPTEARVVALGRLDALVPDVEALIADAEHGPVADDLTRRLRTRLLAPLRLPDGTKRLLISPDGPLHFVPWRLLAEDLDLAVVPSATVLLALERRRATSPAADVLAIANPDPGVDVAAGPVAGAAVRAKFGRLPASEPEARAIATVPPLVGADATKSRLLASLATRPRWRSVHFACHGLFRSAQPLFSGLALTPEGGESGFWTQAEVLRARVPADLVVLSACDTAKGRAYLGGGMVGLTRAFLYAGASAAIGGLWRVDDDATSALMIRFYELWNPRPASSGSGTLSEPGAAPGESKGPKPGAERVSAAEALRRAQEFVRSQEKWKQPRYWAAWVLCGVPD